MVIDVLGCFVCMMLIAVCKLFMLSGTFVCGRLYGLMIVWIGSFFLASAYICMVIVAVSLMWIS